MSTTKARKVPRVVEPGSNSLLTLRRNLATVSAQLADASTALVFSAVDLATAKKQIHPLKRSARAISSHVRKLANAIDVEQRRRSHLPTPDSSTTEDLLETEASSTTTTITDSCAGAYKGAITFGLEQVNDRFVSAIYEMLLDFPECSELGFCKVRVGDDVRRTVDCERISSYTVQNPNGHQSAAVATEDWGGRDELRGKVCSLFIADGDEDAPISGFEFQDMQAAETVAGNMDLDGRALFCSAVESAAGSSHKPYLVIPTECTPEWRASAGLPLEPYVHCGSQLARTAGKISGVHTPYEYISSAAGSGTAMHVEDAMLGSVNVLLAGAPKVWLIVPPSALKTLEAKVSEVLADRLRPARPCSQFVRHMDALLSPKLLDEWNISYHIVTCQLV